MGGAVGGGSGFGLTGEVLAQVTLGSGKVGIGFKQDLGGGKQGRGIVGNVALGFGEGGVKVAPALLVSEDGSKVGVTSGAIWIGSDAETGEVFGFGVAAVSVAGEDGRQVDDGAVEVRIELDGLTEMSLDLGQGTFLHLEERGFGKGSVGLTDLVDLAEGFAGLGLGASDDGGRLLVEAHGFLEATDAAGLKLEREVELVAHLASERDSAAENSELEGAITESVGELAMDFAAIGRSFDGAASVFNGAFKISISIVDGRHPGERLGVLRIALETLLGDGGELAEVSLLEEGFAIGCGGEGGWDEDGCGDGDEQYGIADCERASGGNQHQTSWCLARDISRLRRRDDDEVRLTFTPFTIVEALEILRRRFPLRAPEARETSSLFIGD